MAIGTKIKIGFDATKVKRGMADLQRKFSRMNANFGKAFSGLITKATKFAAALGAAATAAAAFAVGAFVKSSSKIAMDMEAATTSFKVLLGSLPKAVERMKELKKFSTTTPFEPKELVKSSRLLQTLGGDFLATGKGLRLVGDAAAVAGAPLEEVSLHIGRVFAALTQGGLAGESANRLSELGLVSFKIKNDIQELGQAMKKGDKDTMSAAEAFVFLAEAMSKTRGGMAEAAKDTKGKLSTLRGNIDILKEAFGTGINEAINGPLDAMNRALPEYETKFKELGDMAGKALGKGARLLGPIFKDALDENFDVMAAAVEVAFAKLGDVARDSLKASWVGLGATILEADGMFGAKVGGMLVDNSRPGSPVNRLGQRALSKASGNLQAAGDFHALPLSDKVSSEPSARLTASMEKLAKSIDDLRQREFERVKREGGTWEASAFPSF